MNHRAKRRARRAALRPEVKRHRQREKNRAKLHAKQAQRQKEEFVQPAIPQSSTLFPTKVENGVRIVRIGDGGYKHIRREQPVIQLPSPKIVPIGFAVVDINPNS